MQKVLLLKGNGKPGAVKFEPSPSSEESIGIALDPDSSKVGYHIRGGCEGADASSGISRFFLGGDQRSNNNVLVIYFDANGLVRIESPAGVSKTLRVNSLEDGVGPIGNGRGNSWSSAYCSIARRRIRACPLFPPT